MTRRPDVGSRPKRNERPKQGPVEGALPGTVDLRQRPSEPQVRGQVLDFSMRPVAARTVALTFDDGPSEWTGPLLDVLAEYDAPASFFVVGEHIPGNHELLQRMVARGCEVCNHTMTHANLEDLNIEQTIAELADCSTEICKTGVAAPYFYRAPFLNDTPTARAAGAAFGMVTVGCDVIAFDWATVDVGEIVGNVLDGVDAGGEIVLLHDGVPSDRDGNRQPTVDAVKQILPALRSRGIRLVTVSQLLGRADGSQQDDA